MLVIDMRDQRSGHGYKMASGLLTRCYRILLILLLVLDALSMLRHLYSLHHVLVSLLLWPGFSQGSTPLFSSWY